MEPIDILIGQLQGIARSAVEITPQLLISFFVLFVTYLVAKLVKGIASRIFKRTQ